MCEMNAASRFGVLLLTFVMGCSQYAVIGQICGDTCDPAEPAPVDSGRADACAGEPCAADADAGPRDAGATCVASTSTLARTQLDLLLVMDDTASLVPWLPALQEGLALMLQDAAWNGTRVGLQRFDEVCEAEPYANLLVPIAPLPGNAPALQGALPLVPSVSTSTVPALDGALRYARSWSETHDESRIAVVLLTDASPGACDGLIGDWVSQGQRLIRAAQEGPNPIETYVIGFGVMEAVTTLAPASETRMISTTPAEGEVKAALDSVRMQAQPCAFAWQPDSTLTPGSLVVASTSDGGGERRYPIHEDRAACDRRGGFYLDDPAAALPLVACPQTCAELSSAESLSVTTECDGR